MNRLKRSDCIGILLLAVFILFFTGGLSYGNSDQKVSGNRQLMILTSFPPEFYTPLIENFKNSRPDIRVQVLNKKTTAAIAEILRGNNRNFDIFWSSSPDAFVVLGETGRLRRSKYIPHYPPISGKQPYYNGFEQWYHDFALSGVGFMWNEKTLEEGGIIPPRTWWDLTDSRFYGQVAMSTPSRSGTTHLIVESILQDMGWETGWRFLIQLAVNMKTITARSFRVPDGVADGRFGVGLVIDFLAFAKRHVDKNNKFSYGEPTFLIPARVALLNGGQNMSVARSFIDYLLSREGQEVLLQPGINRMPVSKEAFSGPDVKLPYLTSLIRQGKTMSYDTELSTSRYNLVNTMFDQLITYRLLDRKRVWKKMLELEELHGKSRPELIAVRKTVLETICTIPVSAEQSLHGELPGLFDLTSSMEGSNEKKRHLFQEWDRFVTEQLLRAQEIIESAAMSLNTVACNEKL